MKSSPTCPHCGCTHSARSHRKLVEHVLFFVKPYRCQDCMRRFFVLDLFPEDRRML